jgi:hypothetical protein
MATGLRQDTRNDLHPLWGVTHQEMQRLQEFNFVWMVAGRDMRIRGGARTPCLRALKRLHEAENAAETFTPCACSGWMNSPMVRVECPMVNTVSGHFVPVSFRDGCACCLSEAVLAEVKTP